MDAAELGYDRRAPEPLLAALEPGGPLRGLTELALAGDDGDLQLRPRHADLYAGATRVAELRLGRGDRLSLRIGPAAPSDPAAEWPAVERRLRAAIDAARARPRRPDGALHAWLARGEHPGFAVVDRDVKIEAPPAARLAARVPLDAAVAALRAQRVRWAVPSFADRIDALGIDADGRVLVIAAREGADARRTGWAPAQLAMHLALARRWAEQDTVVAADVLEGQRDERLRLGLLPPAARGCVITRPLELVPVLVLAGAPTAATARRMERVAAAVTAAGGDLTELEVLQAG